MAVEGTKMADFHYEWWHVKAKCPTGIYTLEVKAKNKDLAIRHFKRDFDDVIEFYWDTLVLDRTGHQI